MVGIQDSLGAPTESCRFRELKFVDRRAKLPRIKMSTAELLKRISVVIDQCERADRNAQAVLKSEIQMLCERLEEAHGLGSAARSKELLESVRGYTEGRRDLASAQNAVTLLQIRVKSSRN